MKEISLKIYASICSLTLIAAIGCGHKEDKVGRAIYEINNDKFDLAIPVLEEEAKRGNRRAKVIMAKVHAAGLGVPVDVEKAKIYLLCEGSPDCVPGEDEYYLGIEIRDGVGVRKNGVIASQLIQRSMELGFKPERAAN